MDAFEFDRTGRGSRAGSGHIGNLLEPGFLGLLCLSRGRCNSCSNDRSWRCRRHNPIPVGDAVATESLQMLKDRASDALDIRSDFAHVRPQGFFPPETKSVVFCKCDFRFGMALAVLQGEQGMARCDLRASNDGGNSATAIPARDARLAHQWRACSVAPLHSHCVLRLV